MKIKYVILLLVLGLSVNCWAQNAATQTIQWNITAVHNPTAGIHEGGGDKLITYPGNKVEWKDVNGNLKFSCIIESSMGTWSNVAENGMIQFNFRLEGQPGELIIQRNGGVLSAELQVYKAETSSQVYNLEIGSLN